MFGPNADFLLVVTKIFEWGWKIGAAIKVPGTDTNAISFIFAIWFIWLACRKMMRMMFGKTPKANTDQKEETTQEQKETISLD